MNRITVFTAALVASISAPLSATPISVSTHNQYIIEFDDNITEHKRSEIAKAILSSKGKIRHNYTHAIKGMSINLPEAALKQLQERFPDISHIEKNLPVSLVARPDKPKGPDKEKGGHGKGGKNKDGETSPEPEPEPTPEPEPSPEPEPVRDPEVVPWGVQRVGHQVVDYGTAWVIDTGIDSAHPDLNVDVSRGASFVGTNTTEDGNGHGTHVAGTIAAKMDGYDVVGVAAGATVVPIKVLSDTGSGTIEGVIAGVDHIYQHGSYGDCANMSLGAQGFSSALDSAIKAVASKGIIFAIAAGNSADDAQNYTPASTTHPNVYTISAFDRYHNFATFSNYGSVVEFALPGVNILSTKTGGGTTTLSGTSMAAPHFCGLAIINSYYVSGYVNNDPDGNPDPIPSL
ncbi:MULTISPECIES: S8 family serine peptidase [unclassified Photobacterium]|uniref:S8 family serine peptidase n=1 Tax=unclassified Photobacterium TaxID=2628852 RepID=UPI001EDF2CB1|nr:MULTISPECIES: S8 family serine peptidase [unclassified Photobacterium]MCG3865503.1 S8 family serine peptidase [Photobacterium sp. Ph6]MCG3877018.1 S8 family serine peptidase [Photobacterium sp. Ph5]